MGERAKRRFERSLLFSHAGNIRLVYAGRIGKALLAVVVLFAAGLMSKAMLVSTPIVLLLLDYWPLRRFEQSVSSDENLTGSGQKLVTRLLILEKIPLIVLSTVACVITFLLQKRATGAIPPLPFLWRVENAFMSYVIYVWKTVWPTHLAVFYPHPNDTLPIGEVILAIVSILAITAAAIVYRRRRSIPLNRVVLVSRYARPSDWHRPGWRTRPCRPLHVSPSCRSVRDCGLVKCRRSNGPQVTATSCRNHRSRILSYLRPGMGGIHTSFLLAQ